MHCVARCPHLRSVAICRHSTASALSISSSRFLAPCCFSLTRSRRRLGLQPATAASFHTSIPLFAPVDLSSSSGVASSATESVTHGYDSSTDVPPECHDISSNGDQSRQLASSTSELTSEYRQAGRVSFSTLSSTAAPGRKSPSHMSTVLSDEPSSALSTPAKAPIAALVKTNTVTLVSPSTGVSFVISAVDAIPTRAISLASTTSTPSSAPEAIAVARGLRVSAESLARDGKAAVPPIRKVWLLEEGKRFHESVEAAERDLVLDRPDCSSRVLDFAAAYGEAKEALVISPMELIMWVADTLRPVDAGIDEYLNLILFPDLDHHTFSGTDDFCWSSASRPASEPSPPSSPSRTGRSTAASRSLAVRQGENERRFSNVRAVLDRGATLLSQQLAKSASTPVLILDHAGIFIGSPQGHTFFDALESSFKCNLLPAHPLLRMVYNVTGPSNWEFDTYAHYLEDVTDEFPQVLWYRPAPDALQLHLDPDMRLDGSRLVLHVFCAHWQAQYIDLRLRRFPDVTADVRKAMVETLRGVLGEARWRAHQLDLVALAMVGLDSEARATGSEVAKDSIEEFAHRLLGKAATRAAREQVLQRALDAEVRHKECLLSSAADEDEGPHGLPHHLSMHVGNALPFVRPESLSVTLDDVVGQAEAKQALDALITLPMKHPEQFLSGVLSLTSASGVLLYGPPGTGKTMLAKAVAKSAGAAFIAMNPSDIQDKYVGESEKTIKRLFETARRRAPCVIFLDEVDALFTKRDFDTHGYRRDILNEFCMQWDGIKGSKNVIVLGATNRPFDLDEAVLRRFSRRVLVDLPSSTEKRQLLVNLLKDETLESFDLIDSLLPKLVHHSASDIKNVAIAAAMAAVRELPTGPRVLGPRHFEAALKEVRPSVSNAMDAIVKLREFASTMEGGAGGVKRVGFNFADARRGLTGDEVRTRELMVPRLESENHVTMMN